MERIKLWMGGWAIAASSANCMVLIVLVEGNFSFFTLANVSKTE